MTGNRRAALTAIVSNREIVPGTFLMAFEEPRLAAEVRPGQFLMLSIPAAHDPLLPRPFAVFNREGPRVEILYRRVGKGTGRLAGLKRGDSLRALGPLGNGFPLPAPSVASLVVAGGVGIASVHLLLLHLLKHQSVPTTLLYGARSHQEIIPLESLEAQGLRIHIATEDGLRGVKGTVAALLSTTPALWEDGAAASTEAFVCGPMAMLRAVVARLNRPGIRTHVSLESRMACGYGVCQGCAMPFKDKENPERVRYRKVCTDGPVFTADEIPWGKTEAS